MSVLVEARLVAHYAAQVVSAAGATLAAPKADYSHTSLEWISDAGALAGVPLGPGGHRAACRLEDLSLLVLASDGSTVDATPLEGRTLDGATAWLGDALARALGWGLERALARPTHDLPDHELAHGAPFARADREALSEVARWLADADGALRGVAAREPNASPVRCWPHHFDIATLIALDAGASGESARSIGVGLSLGDASYAEPYFYVTPWPYPKGELPALEAGGEWHTVGWTGAVLRGKSAVDGGSVSVFLVGAIGACRGVLRG